MTQLRADDLFPEFFDALTEPVEIVNAAGEVLGRYVPDPEHVRRLYERLGPLVDVAEIERLMAEGGPTFTTRQVFEHLLTLTDDPEERAHLEELIRQRAEDGECPTR